MVHIEGKTYFERVLRIEFDKIMTFHIKSFAKEYETKHNHSSTSPSNIYFATQVHYYSLHHGGINYMERHRGGEYDLLLWWGSNTYLILVVLSSMAPPGPLTGLPRTSPPLVRLRVNWLENT